MRLVRVKGHVLRLIQQVKSRISTIVISVIIIEKLS